MLVLACSLFTGCMDDDWDTPNTEALNKAYGNQEIAETNVITIGSLKEKYESENFSEAVSRLQDKFSNGKLF